jgi:hypothetical protein
MTGVAAESRRPGSALANPRLTKDRDDEYRRHGTLGDGSESREDDV